MAEKYTEDDNVDNTLSLAEPVAEPVVTVLIEEKGRYLCRVSKYEVKYGGYRIDILTENLNERDKVGFICTVCEGIMKEACISPSGEQFCSCCRYYIRESPDVSVRKMINSLKCSCPLIERGCEWLGTLKDCENHLDTCDYVYVSCKLMCGVVLRRNELEKHERETCSQRVVKCDYCNMRMISGELTKHLGKCPKIKVSCNLCGEVMSSEDMERHLKHDCGMEQETCQLGCGVTQTRNELKIHAKDTCVQRKIVCKHCNISLKFCEYSKHFRECPTVKVTCDLCSIGMMYRKDMTEHLNYCPEKMIECPFVKYKCMTLIKRKDMDNHLEEKETKHLGLKLTAMEDLISKQNEEISKQSELLFSITETTKIVWKIEDVTNPMNCLLVSELYTRAGYTFRFRFRQDTRNSLIIVFPETASKYVKPFIAKCTIVLSSKQINCGMLEVKQRDLTRGCVRNITSISQEDIDRYSQTRSPVKKDLTLEIYLTMQ